MRNLVKILNKGLCPYCGGGKIRVCSTRKPTRYYRCDECGARWTSTEYFSIDRDSKFYRYGKEKHGLQICK